MPSTAARPPSVRPPPLFHCSPTIGQPSPPNTSRQPEIRFKDYGSTHFEVGDDGPGVRSDDFAALCRKYYTSKLSRFEDLEDLTSLGFRGEALSSLCAVAVLTVTTASDGETSGLGTRLVYGRDGELVSQEPAPRSV